MVGYGLIKLPTMVGVPLIVVVMGVSGAGKTTIGKLLAEQLGWVFVDADDFHSAANIEKIRQGTALDEKDREPWLEAIRTAELRWTSERQDVVLACSALRQAYRERLDIAPEVRFVYLKASRELISQRLLSRRGHFANLLLLASQFDTLEEPHDAFTVAAEKLPGAIAAEIRRRLGLT
jgi:gluconokinase